MRIKKQLIKLTIILSSILLIISSLNNIIILEEREPVQNDVLNKNDENNNLIPPKSSGAWTLYSIYIDDWGGSGDGTWAFCAANYDWCSFIGGYYLLEDITILSGAGGTGIRIEDSNVPFRIENCTILQKDTGIVFDNVSNGEIRNCYIRGEEGESSSGIYFYNSDYNNIFNNIIDFFRTSFFKLFDEGIILNDCDYNDIKGNLIKGGYLGIYSVDVINTEISFNQILEQEWFGIVLLRNNNCTIEGNLILDSSTGIGLSDTHNSLFKNNFLINNVGGIILASGYSASVYPCKNITYINNVVINEVENEDYKEKNKTINSYDPSFLYGVLIITSGFITIFILKKSKVLKKKSGEI